MENLNDKLRKTQRRTARSSAWDGAVAVHYVLTGFRDLVEANKLDRSGSGFAAYYSFNPYQIRPPDEDNYFAPTDWERYHEHVLDVLHASTGMDVTWSGPGSEIELRVSPPAVPLVDGVVPLVDGVVPAPMTAAPKYLDEHAKPPVLKVSPEHLGRAAAFAAVVDSFNQTIARLLG